MEQDYTDIAKIMQACSDLKRLRILDMLSCGEWCATELQNAMALTQPTISYHMKLLTDVKIVSTRNEGKYVFYSLNRYALDNFAQKFSQLTTLKPDCVYDGRRSACSKP